MKICCPKPCDRRLIKLYLVRSNTRSRWFHKSSASVGVHAVGVWIVQVAALVRMVSPAQSEVSSGETLRFLSLINNNIS